MKNSFNSNYDLIKKSLKGDLGSSEYQSIIQAYLTFKQEIDSNIRNLKTWTKKTNLANDLLSFPSFNYLVPEPLGVVLVIGSWNYPFAVTLKPLISAIAAGNCVIVKPSEFSKASESCLEKIIIEGLLKRHIGH